MADIARTQGTLAAAVAEGIISQDQADAIVALKKRRQATEEPVDLVSNFGDLFLCLGLFILYWSISAFVAALGVEPMLVYGAFAVLFWILAEIFVFKARRKFPAVISVLLFVWMALNIENHVVGDSFSWEAIFAGRGEIWQLATLTGAFALTMIRFRLPILVLGLAVSAVLLIFTYALRHVDPFAALTVLTLCGLALLAIGITLDFRDRSRTGPEHQWALWLFVVGSPLTVHATMLHQLKDFLPTVIGFTATGASPEMLVGQFGGVALTICLFALGFTLLGLLLDRRSLVASSLFYFSVVLTYAAWNSGVGFGVVAALVPLAIGLSVIILGLAWNRLRAGLLRIVPFAHLFRPERIPA